MTLHMVKNKEQKVVMVNVVPWHQLIIIFLLYPSKIIIIFSA